MFHSKLLFQILLTIFALQTQYQIVVRVLGESLEGILAALVLFVASVVVGIGFTVVTLHIAKGRKVSYADIVPNTNTVLSYIAAVALVGAISMLPLIVATVFSLLGFALLDQMSAIFLTILFGTIALAFAVYLSVRWSLVRFAVLDNGGITESIRQSAAITEGERAHLFGFFLIFGFLNIAGAALFVVGLLVTIPVTTIAYAHIYSKLSARVESKA